MSHLCGFCDFCSRLQGGGEDGGVEDRERNDRNSFLTSVTSFGDSTGSLATLGGESVEGILATAGELSPDFAGLGVFPVAPPFVEAAESGELVLHYSVT